MGHQTSIRVTKTNKSTMKISALFIAVVAAQEDGGVPVPPSDTWISGGVPAGNSTVRSGGRVESDKRYKDLHSIAAKVWSKNGLKGKGLKFAERKSWAYGCHCFLLGDRPMSEMGKGKPVDALDNKCKNYKDCQKCVRVKYGNDCIGEFVRYTWKWSSKHNKFVSKNEDDTCEKELFMCDVEFVQQSWSQRNVFSEDYHAFWTTTGFDHEQDCPSAGGNPVDHECCGGTDKPFKWIGLNHWQCCPDGTVLSANDQC